MKQIFNKFDNYTKKLSILSFVITFSSSICFYSIIFFDLTFHKIKIQVFIFSGYFFPTIFDFVEFSALLLAILVLIRIKLNPHLPGKGWAIAAIVLISLGILSRFLFIKLLLEPFVRSWIG